MNPRIDPAIIAEAYDSDPEAARAEYGAEFRDDLADFVSPEAVAAVTIPGRLELPPAAGIVYSAFVDPSGGSADAMALAVGHLNQDNVAILDCLHEVRAPFDPDIAIAECARVLDRYQISTVRGDRYAGEWPVARFKERGIVFEQSARPKSDLYHDLLPLINARRVELLDNRRLASQLCGLERRTSRQGKDSIDHSPSGHDDCANAAAGLLVGLDLDRRPALVRQQDYLGHTNEGIDWPQRIDQLWAVVAADPMGGAAVCYFGKFVTCGPIVLLDFDVGYVSQGLLSSIVLRLAGIGGEASAIFTLKELVPAMQMASRHSFSAPSVYGVSFTAFQLDGLKVPAAAAIASGGLLLTRLALEKGRTCPLGGALDFRPGKDLASDPLRAAAVIGIMLAQPGAVAELEVHDAQ